MLHKRPLAFFSKKLNSYQMNYGVGEKEMLSVVEALKEFRTMIFGYPIDIYTDHKNWTFDNIMNNSRIIRWRLLIEDFAPHLHYIKGDDNVVADTLSRNAFLEDKTLPDDDDAYHLVEECFDVSMTNWRRPEQLVTLQRIAKEQKRDKYLATLRQQSLNTLGNFFEDIGAKQPLWTPAQLFQSCHTVHNWAPSLPVDTLLILHR